jgi:hypothetical protein
VKQEIENCEADPEGYVGPGGVAAECAEMITPTYENYLYRQPMALESLRTDVGGAVITILTA